MLEILFERAKVHMRKPILWKISKEERLEDMKILSTIT